MTGRWKRLGIPFTGGGLGFAFDYFSQKDSSKELRMKRSGLFLVTAVLLLTVSGCCTCNRADWPQAPTIGHMSIAQKKAYLANVRQNLAVFRLTAGELEAHRRMENPAETEDACPGQGFRCEAEKYIELYAMPIINDAQAGDNVETRLEVAKVNLLSAYVYYETEQSGKAAKLLRLFKKRYQRDTAVLNAVVDPGEMGFARLSDGVSELETKLISP
jgi:hypothetical protein